jgi:hypothetical protein
MCVSRRRSARRTKSPPGKPLAVVGVGRRELLPDAIRQSPIEPRHRCGFRSTHSPARRHLRKVNEHEYRRPHVRVRRVDRCRTGFFSLPLEGERHATGSRRQQARDVAGRRPSPPAPVECYGVRAIRPAAASRRAIGVGATIRLIGRVRLYAIRSS